MVYLIVLDTILNSIHNNLAYSTHSVSVLGYEPKSAKRWNTASLLQDQQQSVRKFKCWTRIAPPAFQVISCFYASTWNVDSLITASKYNSLNTSQDQLNSHFSNRSHTHSRLSNLSIWLYIRGRHMQPTWWTRRILNDLVWIQPAEYWTGAQRLKSMLCYPSPSCCALNRWLRFVCRHMLQSQRFRAQSLGGT